MRAEVRRLRQPWGERISAIPVVCTDGIKDLGLYKGSVDGAKFLHYVNTTLAPYLEPFNGINARSVVVLGKLKPVDITYSYLKQIYKNNPTQN